ncbi:MAG TPA: NADH-quinone oxidoreductase subunit NuoE [Rhizomicrobium sp.]|jgi:NADH-quinone oxidoreductase subunit E|nr:NADH-quinone oxidoreductase subunit NuoE [Rhizomicrobium sp.]
MSVRRLAEQQPANFAFSAQSKAQVDVWIAKFPPGRQASAVIAALWIGQEQEGWVTKPMIEEVARILSMAYIRVLEVATFYTMFNLAPVGRFHLQVCTTPPCSLRGSDDVVAVCRRLIGPSQMTPSADGKLSWTEVECLGACTNAPMFQVYKDFYEDLTTETTEKLIEAFKRGETPKPGPQMGGRIGSEPIGGKTTLTDPSLYSGKRSLWANQNGGGGDAPDAEAKKPTQAASDREAPAQKPPGAAT